MDWRKLSPTSRLFWVSLGLPLLMAVATYLLAGATISVAACGTGGAGGPGLGAVIALIAVPPLTTSLLARRQREPWLNVVAWTFLSFVLDVIFIFLAFQLWWFEHNCYT